jgi:hypothetical protein
MKKIVYTQAINAVVIVTKTFELDDSEWPGFWLAATKNELDVVPEVAQEMWGRLNSTQTTIGDLFDTIDESVEVYEELLHFVPER